MKRSFPSHPTAATGCLPVPIFNQKKRNRQPLTSLPQINEPAPSCFHHDPEGFDFSAVSTEARNPKPVNPEKKIDTSLQVLQPMRYSLVHQQYKSNTTGCRAVVLFVFFKYFTHQMYRPAGNKQNSLPGEVNLHQGVRREVFPETKAFYGEMQHLESVKERHALKLHSETKTSGQLHSATNKGTALSRARDQALYSFKSSPKPSKDNTFADMPEEEMVQSVPFYQLTFKEKENSLRIIPATIESMKHWSEYTDRIPLLFEVLATLDSAVTCGEHGSKMFLLRDGKSHVPCVFYEIDRELPRLIRGRVHRAVGNYDKKRTVLKCVSVRPASAAEQQTFKQFITAADKEMERYVRSINEI
ncbi:spermatogenesis-associated protein 22 [Spea bombifrons]|uniref:spermatogenesis-associated protein 22 n=1 Tax=Spea bombifrons TaxID=233779 RepID=UPI00234BAD4E|nr:spermatogenesis-associated protein 22 [Spea bombifrons]